jgi:RNA polymerase sigma factor (sigma-70 family)
MTITCDPTPTKVDPIASHRYVLPIVREISPLAPASSTRQTPTASPVHAAHRRVAPANRRSRANRVELERLVTAAAAGDCAAVSELVQRFAPRVRSVARAHRLAAQDIEDVMQTTWLRLVQHVHTIRDPNAVGAWLESTARHESLRIIKKNNREQPTDNELIFDAPAPPVDEQPLPVRGHWVAALDGALEQLPGRQRKLLSMLFADRSPRYTEISRALGIPIGSIGPTRARSLARLRQDQNLGDVVKECLLDAF